MPGHPFQNLGVSRGTTQVKACKLLGASRASMQVRSKPGILGASRASTQVRHKPKILGGLDGHPRRYPTCRTSWGPRGQPRRYVTCRKKLKIEIKLTPAHPTKFLHIRRKLNVRHQCVQVQRHHHEDRHEQPAVRGCVRYERT